jgi:ATP-binding cassette subfamily F protein 3
MTNRVYEFKDQKIKEHIGDIYDYLAAKKIVNLQELERKETVKQQQKEKDKISQANNSKTNTDQKKNTDKEVNRLKKEIEKTEAEIKTIETESAKLETEMNSPDFYQSSSSNDVFGKYNQLKESHEKKMEEWEQFQEKIENFSV